MIYRDDIVPVLPLYINKINEVITNTTVADVTPIADVTLLTNQDGSPRQSPPSDEYGEDAKELIFKITGPWPRDCDKSWDFFEEPSTEGVIDNHYNGHKKPLN